MAAADESVSGAHLDAAVAARPEEIGYQVVKRAFDIVFSGTVITVLAVPSAVLAAVIAQQTKGSPFYTQRRLGLNGKHFNLIKFRSMVVDADDVEKYFTPEQLEQWKKERKVDDDPRITPIGHFLRKTSLDELPQFLNVFAGQMSVIGVRPIVDDELAAYGDDAAEFLSRKPGITGWWQVEARNDADYQTGTRQQLELFYVRNASLKLDAEIFFRTFGVIFKGTGK